MVQDRAGLDFHVDAVDHKKQRARIARWRLAPRDSARPKRRSAEQAIRERSAEPMNDSLPQAGIAASDGADDVGRADLHQRLVCPGARKPRLASHASVTDGGPRQQYRAYKLDILAPVNVLRAPSEVHSVSPPQRRFSGRVSCGSGRPLVAVTTARWGR